MERASLSPFGRASLISAAAPSLASRLHESDLLPGVDGILMRLNAIGSPVWTSKCDVWPVADFDLDELDGPQLPAQHALACYLDLLPTSAGQWPTLAATIEWCKEICGRVRDVPLRCCRADLIIRHAILSPPEPDLGITAYLTACGNTPGDASIALAAALHALANSILPDAPPESDASKLQ